MSRALKDTPQKMTTETLEFNLEWAERKKSGILATMAKIDAAKLRSLKKAEDFGMYELRGTYGLPNPYDFDLARAEIKRLDWVIGLIKEDIAKTN